MNDSSSSEGMLDTANCPSCPLRRRPSMMKRLRSSFRRAISNKEVLASESKILAGALRPSLSAEMLNSPEAFTEEPCDRHFSNRMTFSATTLWDNLVSYLETNVNPGTRRRSLRMYNNCFFGHEAVNCLHKYITTSLSRQCDREQVAILCHRFLVLGIIEDAKCAPETDQDFSTGLLYRLTAQKKFWELASLKSDEEEDSDVADCKEEAPVVTLTCLSDDFKKPTREEFPVKGSKKPHRSLRRSILETVKYHPRESKANVGHELSSTDEHNDKEVHDKLTRTSDDDKIKYLYSSTESTCTKSSNNDADSSGSSRGTNKWQPQTLVTAHKTKKPALSRKRRWHSVKEKSHKAGNKQAHLIPQLKTKMSLRKKKNGSETNKQWVTFGYI